jgi:hypothetical protein
MNPSDRDWTMKVQLVGEGGAFQLQNLNPQQSQTGERINNLWKDIIVRRKSTVVI